MSKFNQKTKTGPNATTHEGGKAFEKNPLEEWMNMLFSSYLEDGFYEKADEQVNRYVALVQEIGEKYGWEFVAKAAHFSRNELGMRSISHLTAAILNDQTFDHKRNFFSSFFHRPDDVSEVFAAVDTRDKKRSHALVRGAGDYLSTLSDYTLGKYQMKGKAYNMYDLINITHANSNGVNRYKKGKIETPDTWEVKISGAGSKEKRDQEWKRLVEEKRLGYLALIRNLRNILSVEGIDNTWICSYLTPQIENEIAIKNSLVFPYQIYCAYKNMGVSNLLVQNALDHAFSVAAVNNMPQLDGKTAIMLDVSGSMEALISAKSNIMIKEIGAVYAIALFLGQKNKVTFIKFGSTACNPKYRKIESAFKLIEKAQENDNLGYGTKIDKAFKRLASTKEAVDRIFVISDMQTMVADRWYWSMYEDGDGEASFAKYANKFNPDCKCYSFDLGNYRTQCANPNNPNVHLLTSLNDKVFEMLGYIENGDDLYKYINTLKYY